MEIRINPAKVWRLNLENIRSGEPQLHKSADDIDGYDIAYTINRRQWHTIGVGGGLTKGETKQLLEALEQLSLLPE